MKLFFIILIGIGIMAVMVFAAFLMVHDGASDLHPGCSPALVGDCGSSMSTSDFLAMHIGALAKFAAPIPSIGMLLFAAFIIIRMLSGVTKHRIHQLRSETADRSSEISTTPILEKIRAWLALYERRDPSFAFIQS